MNQFHRSWCTMFFRSTQCIHIDAFLREFSIHHSRISIYRDFVQIAKLQHSTWPFPDFSRVAMIVVGAMFFSFIYASFSFPLLLYLISLLFVCLCSFFVTRCNLQIFQSVYEFLLFNIRCIINDDEYFTGIDRM